MNKVQMSLMQSDEDEMISTNLQSSMDEENCTLISSNLLEHGDFEEWLSKNGVESIVTTTNNSDKSNSRNKDSDPLLNQVVIDSSLNDSSMEPLVKYDMFVETAIKPTKPKAEKPNILKSSKSVVSKASNETITVQNARKSTVLVENFESGLTLELIKDLGVSKIFLKNSNSKQVLHVHFIDAIGATTTSEEQSEQSIIQKVTSVNLIKVAENIEESLPQLLTNYGGKLHLCPVDDCDKAFFQITTAKIHTLKHLNIKPYKCNINNCPWAFFTLFKLTRHKETHLKLKQFLCTHPGCSRGFTTISNLNQHRKSHEKPANLPCPVQICNEIFQTERERRLHCKTHDTSEAPFTCTYDNCGKSYFSHMSLLTHQRSYSHKETSLVCNWPNCGRTFENPYRLKQHSRKHTGERPFACSFEDCTWTFTTASKLRRHQSIHTNERKFHCTMGSCNKSFLRSEHLREHTLTHIGQRTCECEVCGTCFTGKSSLYMHLKKVHPEKKISPITPPSTQASDKPSAEALLEQAIQSLGVPSDMMIGTGLLPEEPLELLQDENFSTVNLRDLD